MKISRHNKKTVNFRPTDDCIFLFPVVIKNSRHYKKNAFPVVIKISRRNKKTANFPPEPKTDTIQQHNPPDRGLYLFFPVVIARTAHPTDRRLYLFFPVVMKISRRHKKTANFPSEPKTDTIQQHNLPDRRLYLFFSGRNCQNRAPNRQTTVSFFSGRNRQNRAPNRQTTVSFFSSNEETRRNT